MRSRQRKLGVRASHPEAGDRIEQDRKRWSPGVRARLLFAFLGISAFAVLAAMAGFHAFHEVGGRLDVVETRIPPTLTALELSQSAERIIGAAPALLAATDRARRDEVWAELQEETERLNSKLAELGKDDAEILRQLEIEQTTSSLMTRLAILEDVAARRIETSESLSVLRQEVFQVSERAQRLLAPWIEVTGGEISTIVEASGGGFLEAGGNGRARLTELLDAQRSLRAAQLQLSEVVELLADASGANSVRRLEILAFQLSLSFGRLEATADRLDRRLRPHVLDRIADFRGLSAGADGLVDARKRELGLVAEGGELLGEIERLSNALSAAVDRLGSVAKQDISEAIEGAQSVQRTSARVLIAFVALSLLTSALIVWLYVGRNIVRRLTGLSASMLAIADGRLDVPVEVAGNDEISAMGRAAEVLRRNTLERDSFEAANKYKSQFLSSASHDLRQPLHALNMFVAQLRSETDPQERTRLHARMDAAISSMNGLFEALLDISKLDAGVLEPAPTEFPIWPLLARMEATFGQAAREKGLRLRVVPCNAWVLSDPVLVERILLNLVSNAVRYTDHGGVLVGCRRRAGKLRIDVCDNGPGIPDEMRQSIFSEYVQLAANARGGLGLGLSIVERLSRLLGHPVDVASKVGRGSRFSVSVPRVAPQPDARDTAVPPAHMVDQVYDKLVVIIDDDPLVLDGMGGVLRSWGCHPLTAESDELAIAKLKEQRARPDLIISDCRLRGGSSGVSAIEHLRADFGATIPAFLISGDTAPERVREANARGLHLLHKPVAPMRLRAMLSQLIGAEAQPEAAGRAPAAQPTRFA